jgi:hypothetical protein
MTNTEDDSTNKPTIIESLKEARAVARKAYEDAKNDGQPREVLNALNKERLDAELAYATAIDKKLDDDRETTLSVKKDLDAATKQAKKSLQDLKKINDIIEKVQLVVKLATQLAGLLL